MVKMIIEISDLIGNIVKTFKTGEMKPTIDIEELDKEIFFIRLIRQGDCGCISFALKSMTMSTYGVVKGNPLDYSPDGHIFAGSKH